MSETNRYKQYEPLFGSWYITKEIGQGTVGHVYEIERKELDTVYQAALKAITIPETPDDVKRVLSRGVAREDLVEYYRNLSHSIAKEFQYLARLKGNSYIVNYEDHAIKENEEELKWDILIKTELLTPLIEYSIDNPLDEQDVLRLGADICRALKYCGRYSIIHRDIKPENIFISPSGDFKLGDFGIARVAEETQMDLSRKGTYTYMAPEVFRGQAYGRTADLYSLGLVMYQYLNHGRMPFMPDYPAKLTFDDNEKAFAERMSGKAIPWPAGESSKLKKIISKACSFKAEDRYASADEMLEDLEKLRLSERKRKHRSEKQPEERRPETADGDGLAETVTFFKELKPAETSGKPAVKEKKRNRIYVACLTLLLCIAAVYAVIPKEVTDIGGIDPEVQIYYDGALSPEYTVEPDWFKDTEISFTSGNTDVFTVSDAGEITAVSVGEAELEMKAKGYIETVHVKVVPKVTSIEGIEKEYSLYTGNGIRLEPKLEPDEFSGEPCYFYSSDEAVVTVGEDGTLTAAGPGEAVVSLSAGGTRFETTIYVSDPPVKQSPSGKSSKKKSSKKKSSNKKSSNDEESFGDDEYF